jgi:hypothetical protein
VLYCESSIILSFKILVFQGTSVRLEENLSLKVTWPMRMKKKKIKKSSKAWKHTHEKMNSLTWKFWRGHKLQESPKLRKDLSMKSLANLPKPYDAFRLYRLYNWELKDKLQDSNYIFKIQNNNILSIHPYSLAWEIPSR